MPLQTIHRPKTLDDLIGNEAVVESLQSVLSRETDVPHVYLFTGPAGSGKTSTAFVVKDMLGCSDTDFYYSSARKIEDINEILNNSTYFPAMGSIKFFLIEEAHRITGPALDTLLKFLEFIPDHVYFGLCTSEPERWSAAKYKALKRRCHHSTLQYLGLPQIKKLLNKILEKENINDFPEDVITKITEVCGGSPGQALNLLDTVIDITDNSLALKAIEDATVTESNIAEIARLLLSGKAQWFDIAKLIKGLAGEPESLRYAFLGYFNAVLLGKGTDRVAEMMMAFQESVMYSGKGGLTLAIYFAYKASTS